MAVHVDKAGQDIHAGGVDLARRIPRLAIRFELETGRSGGADFGDAIALDDDIDRPARRRTIALDHRHAANDQFAVGAVTVASLARGDRLHDL